MSIEPFADLIFGRERDNPTKNLPLHRFGREKKIFSNETKTWTLRIPKIVEEAKRKKWEKEQEKKGRVKGKRK